MVVIVDVKSILVDKQLEMERLGNPFEVTFTAEEINVLGDETELRCFKLKYACPVDFKKADNIATCFRDVIDGGGLYKVLEFCMLYNRVLTEPVSSVIPQLARRR